MPLFVLGVVFYKETNTSSNLIFAIMNKIVAFNENSVSELVFFSHVSVIPIAEKDESIYSI